VPVTSSSQQSSPNRQFGGLAGETLSVSDGIGRERFIFALCIIDIVPGCLKFQISDRSDPAADVGAGVGC
jgi:hypothetical protein